MRLEVIVVRDPDSGTDLYHFIDGKPIDPLKHGVGIFEYHVDPGAGYSRTDWDETTASVIAQASPAAGALLKQIRDDYADNEYIDQYE